MMLCIWRVLYKASGGSQVSAAKESIVEVRLIVLGGTGRDLKFGVTLCRHLDGTMSGSSLEITVHVHF